MSLSGPMSVLPSPEFFEYGATLCSTFFCLSPAVQMLQVYNTKGASLGTVNPENMILLFFNSSLWLIWGLFLPMPPAVAPNVIGILAGAFYLILCWGYAWLGEFPSPRWGRRALLGTIGAVLLNIALASYASLSAQTAQHVGNLAMVICICLFAAPLSVLGQVVKDKNSELLPTAQCGMQFLNCLFWSTVGFNQGALQLIVCNGMGLMLATVQLGLIAIYPAGTGKKVGSG
mmetsp:Transcript_130231/g.324709  ORF Transcript_130231/g.324709 Transcript_130231/m.324709 type:complete len:231 (-) Transcript_130231:17-709(-)